MCLVFVTLQTGPTLLYLVYAVVARWAVSDGGKLLFSVQEIILKRAADLAEALYSMPRNANQLSGAVAARSPPSMSSAAGPAGATTGGTGFTTYTSQLAAAPPDTISGSTGQWDETWSHRYPAFTF